MDLRSVEKGNGEREGRKMNLNGHQETKHELLRDRSVWSSASREAAVVEDRTSSPLPHTRSSARDKVLREHKQELKGEDKRHQEEGQRE